MALNTAETPRVAVFGCGHWGKNLVRNLSNLKALAAVCDTDQSVVERMAKQSGAMPRNIDEILDDDDIQAAVVAAPAARHFDLARQLLKAGKHVYVEKPLALEVWQAEELCLMAQSRERTLMVGHLLQYHPAFRKLKKMALGGELGALQYIYSNRLNLGRIRSEENILWSFAPHDISMILSLVGEEPDKIAAAGAAFISDVVADVTTTHLSFPNGMRAHVFVSWLHPFKEQKLVVVGTEGMAVFDDGQPWERKLLHYPHKLVWEENFSVLARADPIPIEVTPDEPLKVECQHFLDCVASGETPLTDGAEGVRVLRVLATAQAALNAERGA